MVGGNQKEKRFVGKTGLSTSKQKLLLAVVLAMLYLRGFEGIFQIIACLMRCVARAGSRMGCLKGQNFPMLTGWHFCIFVFVVWSVEREGFSQYSCIPVPDDYRVLLKVEDGSMEDVAKSLSCILGLVLLPDKTSVPQAVTLRSSKELTKRDALTMFMKTARHACFSFSVSKGVARLRFMGCKKKGGGMPKEVRLVLEPQKRLAILSTEQPLDRSILTQKDAVVEMGNGFYLVDPQIRELAKQDPLAFIDEGAAFPNILGFPEKGMVITYLRDGGFFSKLGLGVFDIVTHVNGLPLATIADAFFAYGALQDSDVLIVRVVRGQDVKYFVYRFGKAQ